jgi:NADH-quinone oxidoreductase subunit G
MSGNVVDLCPVGALGDKDFLYSQRVWFMQTHDGICTGCATGCSISIDENQDRIYRLRPRENPHVNQWWMCDEGRYGFRHVHSPRRIIAPRRRTEHDGNGAPTPATEWEELIPQIDTDLSGAGHLAAAISPHLTIEEAYLLCHYLRRLDSQAVLAVGPVPRVGRDERFRNGFTIRAEKCPNRRGVEELVGHFMGRIWSWDDLLHDVAGGDIGGMWLSGGYKTDWIDEATAAHFSAIKVLVVQALFTSPLSARATYELPAAAFAERDGSYVNHAGRLQSIPWAIRPPAGVLPEGRLLWRLLGRPGMYQAKAVLHEVAVKIPLFAAAAEGVPPHGLDLMVNQLAEVR